MTWPVTRVDRVATVNARIGWKALTADEYIDEGFIFLSTPNIKGTRIDFANVNYITEFRYRESPELMLRLGDVLLAKDGSTLGITALVDQLPAPATVNGSIAVIRPFAIDGRFLRYALASDVTQGLIRQLKDGMGVPHLFQWDIRRLPVPLPPADEQRRIADLLDEQTGRIEEASRLRMQQISFMEARMRSVLDELIEVPGVDRVRLARLATLQSGITVDANRSLDGAEDVPYLRVANVQAGALDLTEVSSIKADRAQRRRFALRPGDVLMTEGGDLDKLGRGTVWRGEIPGAIHQNHVFAVRVRQHLLPDYLAYVTASSGARRHFEATGTKTTNLASTSATKVLDLPVPLRSISDQEDIVSRIRAVEARSRATTDLLRSSIELIRERKRSLISAAVTGELDVVTATRAAGVDQ